MVRNPHHEMRMAPFEAEGERGRTDAVLPPSPADLDAFRRHHAATVAFTDALREERCRRTGRFDAGVGETVDVLRPLVGPWNLELLFLLYVGGPQRFSALKRTLGGVSSRVLTDKVRHLADEGLLARRSEGRAVTYALTPRGETVARHLHPIVFYLRNADSLRPGP